MERKRLTAEQNQILELHTFSEEDNITEIVVSVIFEEKGELKKLVSSIRKLYLIHPILTTRIIQEGNQATQYVSNIIPEIVIKRFENEKELELYINKNKKDNISIEEGLCSINGFTIGNKIGLIIKINHLIGDAFSISVLINTFYAIFFNKKECESEYQYYKYIDKQNNYLNSSRFEIDENYWINKFGTDRPINYISPIQNDLTKAGRFRYILPKNTSLKIEHFCKNNNISVQAFFLGLLNIYFAKRYEKNEFNIGVAINHRNKKDDQRGVGMFVTTLVFNMISNLDLNVEDYFSEVRSNYFGMLKHSNFDYYYLEQALIRDKKYAGKLYDVYFSYHPETDFQGKLFWYAEEQLNETLSITLSNKGNDNFVLIYDYQISVFDNQDIIVLNNHLQTLLDDILIDEKVAVSKLNYISKNEYNMVINEFNKTFEYISPNEHVMTLWKDVVEKHQDNDAVVCLDKSITYKELNNHANSIANYLHEKGVKKGEFVGIIAEKSIELIEAIIGILKIGGVYVPIDPNYPLDRIAYIVNDAGLKIALTNVHNILVNNLDLYFISEINNINFNEREVKRDKDDLVYSIYTSGTTGQPKGVLLKNSGLVNLIHSYTSEFEMQSYDRFLQFANYCFDQSVGDIFGTLMHGACLVVVPNDMMYDFDELAMYIKKNKITLTSLTPSVLKQLDLKTLENLRLIDVGGEASKLEDLKYLADKVKVLNSYGPTECTVNATIAEIKPNEKKITIGKPICNTEIYIFNSRNEICGINVKGELCIAGDCVSAGYNNKPELTKERFVINPITHNMMYKTGDLASWTTDGNVVYYGRIDEQVKIHGYRIELGEIENAIRSTKLVKDVIVKVNENENLPNNAVLCAYCMCDRDLDITNLRNKLRDLLPYYMVPSLFAKMNSFPLTINGKVDKNKLNSVELEFVKTEYIEPTNSIQKTLCRLYEELLAVERVGIEDNFFELGGSSLLATRLAQLIENKLAKKIKPSDVLKYSTIRELEEVINNKLGDFKLIKAPLSREYELSFQEEQIWYASQNQKANITYNLPIFMELNNKIDFGAVKKGILSLVKEQETLRSSYIFINGKPQKRILSMEEIYIDNIVECVEVDEADIEVITDEFVKPFNLSEGPLFRCKLVNSSKVFFALFDFHHIICDGESIEIIFDRLANLIEDDSKTIIVASYKDYAYTIRTNTAENIKYWKKQLADFSQVAEYPLDKNRPKEYTYNGDFVECEINKKLYDRVNCFAIQHSVSPFMVYLATLAILTNKYTREEDFILGVAAEDRSFNGLEKVVGMFVNSLPIRCIINQDYKFIDILNNVRKSILDAFDAQQFSLIDLLNELEYEIGTDRNPLYDVMIIMQTEQSKKISFAGNQVKQIKNLSKFTKLDLTFNIYHEDNSPRIVLEYNINLFNKTMVEKILEHYLYTLDALCMDDNKYIKNFSLCTPVEKNTIIANNHACDVKYNKYKTYIDIFEEAVRKYSNKVAIHFEDKIITYNELNNRANIIANELRNKGVKPCDFVVLLADRGIELVIGLFGIIKAGATYVPIGIHYPKKRIEGIIEDCMPKAVVTYKYQYKGMLPCVSVETCVNGNSKNPTNVNTPDDPIYCIYTSGSTGEPKGVLVSHKNLVNYVNNSDISVFNKPINSGCNKIVSSTNVTFDIFGTEIHLSLINGIEIYLCNEEQQINGRKMFDLIEKEHIDIIQTTPSRLNVLFESLTKDEVIESLKYVYSGGEEFSQKLVQDIYRHTRARAINVYGPTEATIWATSYEIQGHESIIPIGKPLNNYQICICDGDNLCGIGVPGELCISGEGVAIGYHNRTELTENRFVESIISDGRMYRTGDLARMLPTGDIIFMGRMDDQVKYHGYRIELGEINNAVRNIENVIDVVTVINKDEQNADCMCCYITADKKMDLSLVKDRLFEILPYYMVPERFMQIDEMPLNASGKIAKRELPIISYTMEKEYVKPNTNLERAICSVFEFVLKVESVGLNSNFYELGGNSLKAAKIANRLYLEYGVTIKIKDILQMGQIYDLVKIVERNRLDNGNELLAGNKLEAILTEQQKQMYITSLMSENTTAYNVPIVLKYKGALDVKKFEKAINLVADKNIILKTKFSYENNVFKQKVDNDIWYKVDIIKADSNQLEDICRKFIRPFDLEREPLGRILVVKCGINSGYIIMDFHHIIIDGQSVSLLLNDISNAYTGKYLNVSSISYFDYCNWIVAKNLEDERNYWCKQLKGIERTNLPLDHKRTKIQSFAGASSSIMLDKELVQKVDEICKLHHLTRFSIYVSTLMIMLSHYSLQDDIVIGTIMSGRIRPELEQIIGLFINTVVLRTNPQSSKKILEYLIEVKHTLQDAWDNQSYPFERLINDLNIKRDASRNPIFDVMIVEHEKEIEEISLGDIKLSSKHFDINDAQMDLVFDVINEGKGTSILVEYCTEIFEPLTIKFMLNHFVQILKEMVKKIHEPIGRIEILSSEEKLLIDKFNNTEKDYEDNLTAIDLFYKAVGDNFYKTAIIFENEKISYGELDYYSNIIAKLLIDKGVIVGDYVPIISKRSWEMLAGILGIIKTGAAYVPIDDNYPFDRQNNIIKDCGAKIILTYGIHDIYSVDKLSIENIFERKYECDRVKVDISVNDLIYCIYTSGTTGKPKGVEINHKGISNLTQALGNTYGISNNDVILQYATIAFDSSVWEIFMALLNGSTLCVASREERYDVDALVNCIKKNNISVMLLPPQFFAKINNCPDMRLLFTAGSSADTAIVENVSNNTTYINEYGPTEGTVCATYWKHEPGDTIPEEIPIGKPIDNKQIYIMQNSKECGIGVPGELCIAGVGLAVGYHGNEELTNSKFVYHKSRKCRIYKSGDYARWLPDGNIEYMGRIDGQVKIRGYRVELSEILSEIKKIDGIDDAAVITQENKEGDNDICAFVVSEANIDFIKAELAKKLPDYMLPKYVSKIEAIPVTERGKLNKAALPKVKIKSSRQYIAPQTFNEIMICEVMEDILGVKHIGKNDNFFELGGDSIKAIRLITCLKDRNISLSVLDVIELQTVFGIAKKIDELDAKNTLKYIVKEEMIDYSLVIDSGKITFINDIKACNEPNEYIIEEICTPNIMQLMFIRKYSKIFNVVKVSINGKCNNNDINELINHLVVANKTLRTVYDVDKNKILVISAVGAKKPLIIDAKGYSNDYFDKIAIARATDTHKVKNYSLLSDIWAVRFDDSYYCIYLVVHHAIWDYMCNEIFTNKINMYLNNYNELPNIFYNKMENIDYDIDLFYKEYCEVLEKFAENLSDYQYQKHYVIFENSKDVLDDFNKNPIIYITKYFLKSNRLSEKCKKVPLAIFYHNRNAENASDLGLHLILLPAIYDCEKETVRGGSEFLGKYSESVLKKFLTVFNQYGAEMIPLINIRNVFKNNLVEESILQTGLNKVIDQYKQKMAITIDVSDSIIKADFPKYVLKMKEINE